MIRISPVGRSGSGVARVARLGRRAHHSFRYDLDRRQRQELIAYTSFVTTVGVVHSITRLIRDRPGGPFRDLHVGDLHVHHYLPGIALLACTGAVAMRGSDAVAVHCLLGASYGAGCALVADELPLLLSLRDVYWLPEGAWRVQLTMSLAAGFGAYFAGIPLWRALADELRHR